MNPTITFNVNGIKCGGCETTIQNTLQALPGVLSVQASSQQKVVVVQFDSSLIDPDSVKDAIVKAGYPVQENG